MNDAPCLNCKNRKFVGNKTCHSTCKIYQEWQLKQKQNRIEKHLKERLDDMSYAYLDLVSIKGKRRR